jgi:Na+/melibiose symporter-like transporter
MAEESRPSQAEELDTGVATAAGPPTPAEPGTAAEDEGEDEDEGQSVWRNRDFVKFWVGQSLSQFGSQVTMLALPLAAIITLQATPVQVGALNALQNAPFLVLALFAGVLADRLERRRIMLGADVGRALVLGSVPLAAAAGLLRIEWLYAVALLTGSMTVLFQVCYQAYLPVLVPPRQIRQGNSALEFSTSLAQFGGPAASGALVQALTAPIAIAFDAVSFMLSAGSLALIRRRPPPPPRTADASGVWSDIREGLGAVFRHPLLRSMGVAAAIFNLFFGSLLAVYTLFMARELRLSTAAIGLVFTAVGPGLLVGALTTSWLNRKLPTGLVVAGAALVSDGVNLIIPFTHGSSAATVALLAGVNFVAGFGVQVFNITTLSLRQVITPARLLGRVTATIRLIAFSLAPLGSVTGGLLGGVLGLRPAVLISSIGLMLAFVWVAVSPLGRLRSFPEQADSPGAFSGGRA